MTEELYNRQTWLECRNTGLARRLKVAFDPVLLAEKEEIQKELVSIAAQIGAAHERTDKPIQEQAGEILTVGQNGTGNGAE